MIDHKNMLDQEKCIKCQLCIEVCPCNILGINSNHEVHFIKERESICLQCGQCMAICSTKAIQARGISYESDLFDLPENDINYKSFIDFLSNHLYPIAKLDNYKLEYGDRITRGAPAMIIFHAEKGAEEHTDNSLIYATYAMLAAHSLGVGPPWFPLYRGQLMK